MIVAIRITTARPHRARTHRLRYQGEGFSAASMLKSRVGKLSTSSGRRLAPTVKIVSTLTGLRRPAVVGWW